MFKDLTENFKILLVSRSYKKQRFFFSATNLVYKTYLKLPLVRHISVFTNSQESRDVNMVRAIERLDAKERAAGVLLWQLLPETNG